MNRSYLDSLPLDRRLHALLSQATAHVFQFDRLLRLLPQTESEAEVLAQLQQKALLVQVGRPALWQCEKGVNNGMHCRLQFAASPPSSIDAGRHCLLGSTQCSSSEWMQRLDFFVW